MLKWVTSVRFDPLRASIIVKQHGRIENPDTKQYRIANPKQHTQKKNIRRVGFVTQNTDNKHFPFKKRNSD